MATITDYSNTEIKVTVGSDEYVLKKTYCTLDVDGDYLNIFYHQYEMGKSRGVFQLLYSDVITPSESSASDLRTTIQGYLDNYGSATGGGLSINKTMAHISAY